MTRQWMQEVVARAREGEREEIKKQGGWVS